eukprot:6178685-Pleurochrysis_carterae.AAC.3
MMLYCTYDLTNALHSGGPHLAMSKRALALTIPCSGRALYYPRILCYFSDERHQGLRLRHTR